MMTWSPFRVGGVLVVMMLICVACEVQPPSRIGPKPTQVTQMAPGKATSAAKVTPPPVEPILIEPKTRATSVPLLVLLHGYGSNHRDLVSVGRLARRLGWASLSIPAPVKMGKDRYAWRKNQPAQTHAYIQGILKAQKVKHPWLDASSVYLAGFSQGGLHSTLVTTLYPKFYLGVLAISPAGWSDVPARVTTSPKRPICMVGGTAERPRYREKFKAVAQMLKASKWPVQVSEHRQGHHFPRLWQGYFMRCFEMMKSGVVSTTSPANTPQPKAEQPKP